MIERFRVGVVASTHGIKGEVKVYPTTDDAKRFKKLKEVIVDMGKGREEVLEIAQVRFFKNLVILKFKGIDDINVVEKYKKKDLLIHRKDAVKLQKDEHFIADLLGLSVVTDKGETLGTVDDVLQTGANDVYVVKTADGGEEILLPVIRECVLDIDLDKGEILVHIMEGLLD